MILTYSVYPVIIDCAVAISISKDWAIISQIFKDLFDPCPNTDMRKKRQHTSLGIGHTVVRNHSDLRRAVSIFITPVKYDNITYCLWVYMSTIASWMKILNLKLKFQIQGHRKLVQKILFPLSDFVSLFHPNTRVDNLKGNFRLF